MDFNFARLVFTLRLDDTISDPYIFFSMREAFLAAFRKAVACRCTRCERCPHPSRCPYYQVVSQSITSDPAAVKRYQKPSFPFVFDLPVVPPVPNRGITMGIGLTLMGVALNHIPYFIAAMRLLLEGEVAGRRIRALLEKVESSDYADSRYLIMDRSGEMTLERLSVLSLDGLQGTASVSHDVLTVTMETPLRIIHDGKPLREFSGSLFLRALFRRISSLVYHYGGIEMDTDFKWLADRSSRIDVEKACFHWVEWKRSLQGLLGSVAFRGDMTDYLPFVLLGEYVHVGKGSPFGLGRYRIDRE